MRFILLSAMLFLTACATPEKINLSAQTIASYTISEVRVTPPPENRRKWNSIDNVVAQKLGVPYPQMQKEDAGSSALYDKQLAAFNTAMASPEAEAMRLNIMQTTMNDEMRSQISPLMRGTNPAFIDVKISAIHVPHAFMSNIIAGDPTMSGSVHLVDANSGTILAVSPEFTVRDKKIIKGVLGLAMSPFREDPYTKMSEKFALKTKEWMQP